MERDVAQLRAENQELRRQMSQIFEMFGSMKTMFLETITEVKDLIKESRCRCQGPTYAEAAKPTKFPSPTPQLIALQGLKEFQSAQDQKKNQTIVLVGCPEEEGDGDVLKEKLKEMLNKEGVVEPIEKVFRHGLQRPDKTRIVKLRLASASRYKEIRRIIGRSQLCKYARNDLSPSELFHDKKLRSWTHEENKKLGMKKFKVFDLRLVEDSHPRPLGEKTVEEEKSVTPNPHNGDSSNVQ